MRRFLLLLTLIASSQVFAAPIRYVGHVNGGPGCPQGSVQVVMTPDGSSFTVIYDRLNLHLMPGQGTAATECEVDISLNKPPLLGMKVMSADFRGFVGLSPNVWAEQRVSVAAGLVKEFRRVSADFGQQSWVGPTQQNFNLQTVHTRNPTDILSCLPPNKKTHVIIKTKLQVYQRGGLGGEGILAVDSTDGRFTQRFDIQWVDCVGVIGGLLGGLFGGR